MTAFWPVDIPMGRGGTRSIWLTRCSGRGPSIVLALGGQKGGSTIHIVETMRPMGSGGNVIAGDTELGN